MGTTFGELLTENGDKYDVVIIGGGPAGIAAGIWCADLGLKAILLEKNSFLGGQLLQIYNPITNYPGVETPNGKELCDRFVRQISSRAIDLRTDVDIASVDLERKQIRCRSGTTLSAKAIVIATGVRRRRLGIPGEDKYRGRGFLDSGAKSRDEVAGKRVVIVGGGDAAIENALLLSEKAARVTVIHRRDHFTARPEFLNAIAERKNVEFVLSSTVRKIAGNENVETVEVILEDGTTRNIAADYVLIRVGVQPNSEIFRSQIERDPMGYFRTDANEMTSVQGVYAVGDIANLIAPTIATAVGTAAIATKHISRLLGDLG